MRSLNLFLACLMVGVAFFVSCVRGAVRETIPSTEVTPIKIIDEVPGKGTWEDEWQRTVAAAKKEKKVVVYMTAGAEVRTSLVNEFGKKFGIVAEAISLTGIQMSEKLKRERRAELYYADVYQGGASTPIIILKPEGIFEPLDTAFILPELKDPELIQKTWWEGRLPWVDKEHNVFAFMAILVDWAAINTDMVRPEEMRSFRDLLNPKWKGKILMYDPSMTGVGGALFCLVTSYIYGLDFWREFSKQEPIILRDHRQMAEWVARGKYLIAVASRPEEIQLLKQTGAPIVSLPQPRECTILAAGSGSLCLINKAPHPNAAKIYINWLLSKEGLTIFTKAYGAQSARLDVPTDFLPPDKIRQPAAKIIWQSSEEFLMKERPLYKEAREIFEIK